jgi:tetratricopeptide (TPR) repeat protein
MSPSDRPRSLESAIDAALAAGNDATALDLLRRAFGGGRADLAELLEELTEYRLAVGRPEAALDAAARALLVDAGDAEEDVLRRRSRIAEILLAAGLPEEAFAVFADVAQEGGDATCVHEAAGRVYLEAGETELALGWLTAGLEIAVADGDPGGCGARVLDLRRGALTALGRGRDALDGRAASLLPDPVDRTADVDDLIVIDELDRDGIPAELVLGIVRSLRQDG